jgi:hypothetical protein
MAMSGKRLLAVVLTVVVAAAVVTGIVIIGSPMDERTRRLDTRRVQDLQQISQAVQVYHGRHQRTPASLDELSKEPGFAIVVPRDPTTGQPYRYVSVDADSYELCGIFDRDSDARTASFWSHGAGTQCFRLNVKQATVP